MFRKAVLVILLTMGAAYQANATGYSPVMQNGVVFQVQTYSGAFTTLFPGYVDPGGSLVTIMYVQIGYDSADNPTSATLISGASGTPQAPLVCVIPYSDPRYNALYSAALESRRAFLNSYNGKILDPAKVLKATVNMGCNKATSLNGVPSVVQFDELAQF